MDNCFDYCILQHLIFFRYCLVSAFILPTFKALFVHNRNTAQLFSFPYITDFHNSAVFFKRYFLISIFDLAVFILLDLAPLRINERTYPAEKEKSYDHNESHYTELRAEKSAKHHTHRRHKAYVFVKGRVFFFVGSYLGSDLCLFGNIFNIIIHFSPPPLLKLDSRVNYSVHKVSKQYAHYAEQRKEHIVSHYEGDIRFYHCLVCNVSYTGQVKDLLGNYCA